MSRNDLRLRQYAAHLLLTILLLPATAATHADTRQIGRYDVHYTVFAADFLQPEIASTLGVVRAKDRAILNVSVRLREPGGTGDQPVEARPVGTRSDLVHATTLDFRPVHEPGAIYYLAEFPFQDGERVLFDLRIELDGQPVELRFDKTLYVD